MNLIVSKTEKLSGSAKAPPSKSHTHRAIIIASLASGTSTIKNPLLSGDCLSTMRACKAIGAEITVENGNLIISGVNGKPTAPRKIIDVKNSGTTIRIMSAISALCNGEIVLTGDESIQKRPIQPLLDALNSLGANAVSLNKGNPPVKISGKLKGGEAALNGISSQFLSALLIACPLAEGNTKLKVSGLKSRPYVNLTLEHLKSAGAIIEHEDDFGSFTINGKQNFKTRDFTVPADFSSAAFLLAAGAITGSKISVEGLDMEDAQGDRAIIDIIELMKTAENREIDLSNSPDLLPITAVLGCFARRTTIIKNVEHARLKESDRIAAICAELKKMGARIEERKDGLVVSNSKLKGTSLNGHKDHRIVMALAVAGLGAEGQSKISDADMIATSFPDFVGSMQKLGANIHFEERNG